jgi:hypothetical protein
MIPLMVGVYCKGVSCIDLCGSSAPD